MPGWPPTQSITAHSTIRRPNAPQPHSPGLYDLPGSGGHGYTRQGEDGQMALLLPEADGIAGYVARQLPQAAVLSYGETSRDRLAGVTFYCLPYMGHPSSI